MLKLLQLICIFSVLVLIPSLFANTYYIDNINGDDLNTGLAPSSAWKTVQKVNSSVFYPGDYILFKSGQKWREQLVVPSSGAEGSRIIISSYDSGDKPILTGAEVITGFSQYSSTVWKINTGKPQQVFYNNIRGAEQTSLAAVNADKEWFFDTLSTTLYIYSSAGNPDFIYTSPGIEVTVRPHCIFISQQYVTIENLQLEKVYNSAVEVTALSSNIIINNISFYQWSSEINFDWDGDDAPSIGAVDMFGSYSEIKNCTFGKTTGADIEDQGWAGFVALFINGRNNIVHNNFIYHNSFENETRNGNKAYGIRLYNISGTTEVFSNYIYHTGSHGIYVSSNSVENDTIKIYDNVVEYPGQAGVSAYRTRKEDGIGGKGFIFKNHVAFANRLGGDTGGGGSQASGIHLNNGKKQFLDPLRPFMKWYVFENIVHNSQTIKKPNGHDSDGIGVDFNADEVEIFRNLVYNNWGKGIYMWNANKARIYYNIVYGNDTGSTITAATNSEETADFNLLYNNTFYKNYNTDAYGPNYNTEIYFGGNGKYNVFKNNILYGDVNGVVYYYRDQNSPGCITDNNIVYKEGGYYAWDTYNKYQTFEQWKKNHPQWDQSSINSDPKFADAPSGNFELQPGSPAIDKGILFETNIDFKGNTVNGLPDIGAIEYNGVSSGTPLTITGIDNFSYDSLKVSFSLPLQKSSAENISNYLINNGVNVISAALQANLNEVLLQTTNHTAGQSYILAVNNIKDTWGNTIAAFSNISYGYKSVDTLRIKSVSIPFYNKVIIEFTTKFDPATALDVKNYVISNGISVTDASINEENTIVTLTTTEHFPGMSYNIVVNNITDRSGNMLASDGSSYSYTFDLHFAPNIILLAENGKLAEGADLKIKQGSIGALVAFCNSTASSITFNISMPDSGVWYLWARQFYEITSSNNSFFISIDDDSAMVLGDNNLVFDQWYWGGNNSGKLRLGYLPAGEHQIKIYGREPGPTVMIDQVILTQDPSLIPTDTLGGKFNNITLRASDGTADNGTVFKTQPGSINSEVAFFSSGSGTLHFNTYFPASGKWYAWGRIYKENQGQSAFIITIDNGAEFTLGDKDTVSGRWHWNGYDMQKLDLGIISEGQHVVSITGKDKDANLFLDMLLLSNNPDYRPQENTTTGVKDDQQITEVPKEFRLQQNYPNPFNPSTVINFSLPAESHVELKIYNAIGSELVTLINEFKPAGNYSVKFDVNSISSGFSSGVYFYMLRAGNFVQTRKMILMK